MNKGFDPARPGEAPADDNGLGISQTGRERALPKGVGPVVKLDVLAEVLAGLKPVRVRAYRCLTKLTPKAQCDACRTVCPEGAITLTLAPVLADCSACGLCAAACPSDVFTLDGPSDQELLQQVAAAARRVETVAIACGRVPATGPHVVRVVCLGRLTPEFLLAAVACGPGSIDLVRPRGGCGSCDFSAGAEMVETAVARVLPLVGRLGFAAQVAPAASRTGAVRLAATPLHQDRRSFLLGAFGLLRETAPVRMAGLGPTGPEEPTALPVPAARWTADPVARSPRRAMLQWALQTAAVDSALPWATGRVRLKGPCHHCGVCGALCPDKAIAVVAGSGGEQLEHAPGRCLSCGLCVAVCPSGALEIGDPGPLSDLAHATAKPLGDAATLRCAECGADFPATVPVTSVVPHCLPCLLKRSAKESAFHA